MGIPLVHANHHFKTTSMKNEKENSADDKKKRKKKIILISIGTTATGILSYFGWQWWKSRKAKKEQEKESADESSYQLPSPPRKSSFLPSSAPQRNDDFPLKKGSKGSKVKTLQQALIAKYGKDTLPKYGADGDFGTEMVNALKKLNLSEEID